MKPANKSFSIEAAFEKPNFRVVVGYEDYPSGVRAIDLYNRIIRRWGEPDELQFNLWKFEPLGVDALRETAAVEALAADLVLISIRGDHSLPSEAHHWLQTWIHLKEPGSCALALLVDDRNRVHENALKTRLYLHDIVSKCGLEFLTSPPMDKEFAHYSGDLLHKTSSSNSFLETVLHVDRVDHWGINE